MESSYFKYLGGYEPVGLRQSLQIGEFEPECVLAEPADDRIEIAHSYAMADPGQPSQFQTERRSIGEQPA